MDGICTVHLRCSSPCQPLDCIRRCPAISFSCVDTCSAFSSSPSKFLNSPPFLFLRASSSLSPSPLSLFIRVFPPPLFPAHGSLFFLFPLPPLSLFFYLPSSSAFPGASGEVSSSLSLFLFPPLFLCCLFSPNLTKLTDCLLSQLSNGRSCWSLLASHLLARLTI